MKLRELIQVCNGKELSELYAFWNGEGPPPADDTELRSRLLSYMTSDVVVRRRLRFLSRRLVDLLRYFLGRHRYEASLENIGDSHFFSFMGPYEVEAAVRALVKRGFLFPCRRTTVHPHRYTIPFELGDLLRGELEDLDLSLSEAFSLAKMLAVEAAEASGGPPPGESLDTMLAPPALDARISVVPLPIRELYDRALDCGGGLLPRSVLLRDRGSGEELPRRLVKESLEKARLGTVRHLALGEYGINHFEDTVILFDEVLRAELGRRVPDPAEASLVVRALGVDLLSDLSQFLGRLSREKVRLTQSGSVYRTAARKIEEQLILAAKRDSSREGLFQFVFQLALSRHLVRRSPERLLVLTSKGRTWPRLSVGFKLKELLAAVVDDPQQHFHRPRLQEHALAVLRSLTPDRWYDFGLLVGVVRHSYLSSLDEEGVREAYQSRYQYSSEAHTRDLPQITQMIAGFLSEDLHLLGLVDLALAAERPRALRLSPLAAKVFGNEGEDSSSAPRLLVNPDFEVLLFPEGDSYDLIQRLDRFAERISPEGASRFRITERTVERAVAAGMSAAEILETLSENSASELPQNVVYSIRDFAEKVKFVRIQRAFLVHARHKEVIDQLVRHGAVRREVMERLSPRLLALSPEANLEELLPLLEKEGVFVEGEPAGAGECPEEGAERNGDDD
jgi:hypothetical protein